MFAVRERTSSASHQPDAVRNEMVAEFRTAAMSKLDAVERGWRALMEGHAVAELEKELKREVHTLKGESRLVGFVDVELACHKLEELVFAASRMGFRVAPDFDFAVIMAVRFIAMLLRKQAGRPAAGADLRSFSDGVDEILRSNPSCTPQSTAKRTPSEPARKPLSEDASRRIARGATEVFLEALRNDGPARTRLISAFEAIAKELPDIEKQPIGPLLAKHARAVHELATSFGKEVDVSVESPSADVPVSVIEAIDTTLVHALRNAVDHGIETPEERVARGKPPRAYVLMHVRESVRGYELLVFDDGRGVDRGTVVRRGLELGMLEPAQATTLADDDALALVFEAGFSTRSSVSSVSGRGIGLDAAKAAVDKLGGTIRLSSECGANTRVLVTLPVPPERMMAHVFSFGDILVAVPLQWSLFTTKEPGLDPLRILGLPSPSRTTNVELACDGLRVRWSVGEVLEALPIRRVCPVGQDSAVEVVRIAGTLGLLINPAHASFGS